ncbi:bifunctional 3'-5' exonuclease/DNA polymerase [Nocardiopsis xinjiangensis]|uniref:bifunctional 3'-5' exonuclease/DNA polymerase n=1 Tax=Nocardiopsis xinjiangensis TaxID=124285 RepID=UPI00034DBEB1|nr:bifunctional 3'-5' exonuclease/DNA polymerase [Nocardiopsis xinjiangensis]
MRIAVVADGEGGGWLQELGRARPERVGDLAAAVGAREAAAGLPPRWVWAAWEDLYPDLVRAGVRVRRCHDAALTEALLLGHAGRHGEPRSLGAAWARLHHLPVPEDPVRRAGEGAHAQPALFEADRSTLPPGTDRLAALVGVHADQNRRLADLPDSGGLRLLAAVESAGGLAAAEMSHDGLPLRPDVHDRLLTELLGPRPVAGQRPRVLADLAARIGQSLGQEVNPDSPSQVLRALAGAGHPVPSTRSWVLQEVDHPAAPLLLRYKELARLHSANGWAWSEQWVSRRPGPDGTRLGRFHPDYVVAGVVSGRWATRGGGGLQVPKALLGAVRADPGWVLVRADAGQLEPRVLAAVSGDRALAEAAAEDDLYARLAVHVGGDRDRAKIGMLAAMYGQTTGDAAPLLATMRRLFPRALEHVDSAARTGENGGTVRSWLGRTSPRPHDLPEGPEGERARRAQGRFTRNFVVQATAAEWASVLLAALRTRLADLDPALPEGAGVVFFVHDEVVLHVPAERADAAVQAVAEAERETRELLFPSSPVRFPLVTSVSDERTHI